MNFGARKSGSECLLLLPLYLSDVDLRYTRGVKSGNEQLCKDISSWAFQESLVLRVDSVTHHRVNETSPPEQYTTNDYAVCLHPFVYPLSCISNNIEQTYTAHISKYNPTSLEWEPYSGIRDLQLEFTMLDPHIRTSLPAVRGQPGMYSVTFRVPDRHGVFKFVLDWKRSGCVSSIPFLISSVPLTNNNNLCTFFPDTRSSKVLSQYLLFHHATTAIRDSCPQRGHTMQERLAQVLRLCCLQRCGLVGKALTLRLERGRKRLNSNLD